MRVPLPGVTMLVLGAVEATVRAVQSPGIGDLGQWLTAGGFLAVGIWAVKDHIALRKEKVSEVRAKTEADRILAGELQAIRDKQTEMHEENRRRFDKIDSRIEGDEAYAGLLHGDRRNTKRRHFLMGQLAAFGLCLVEMNKGIGNLTDKQEGVEYAEEEIAEDLREIIKRLRQSDEEQLR